MSWNIEKKGNTSEQGKPREALPGLVVLVSSVPRGLTYYQSFKFTAVLKVSSRHRQGDSVS